MTHEELEGLAGLYALGALDGEDLQNFVRHLATCESCRKLVSEYERVSADLASVLPPGSPRPELRSKILAEVLRSPSRVPRGVGWPLGAAAAALVAVILGILLYSSHRDASSLELAIAALHRQSDTLVGENHTMTQEIAALKPELESDRRKLKEALDTVKARDQDLENKNEELGKLEKQAKANQDELSRLGKMDALIRDMKTQIFSLAGGDPAKEARGRVLWKDSEILFWPTNLPPLPATKLYELWLLVPDKDPIPANLYDGSGKFVKEYRRIPPGVDKVIGFAVTLEDQQGSDKPTSALYLLPQKN